MLRPNIGSLAATIQSIVYGGTTGGLFSLLQSAGATIVLPSIGTIFTGAAATGAGVAMATADQPGAESNSELLYQAAESIVRGDNPDDDGNPPPYRATGVPEVYLLTPRAILAIAKAFPNMHSTELLSLTSEAMLILLLVVVYILEVTLGLKPLEGTELVISNTLNYTDIRQPYFFSNDVKP